MSIWLIPVVVAMAAGVWFVVWRSLRLRTREQFHCSGKDLDVEVQVERQATPTWSGGRAVDIIACTAFGDPARVTCDRGCIPRKEVA